MSGHDACQRALAEARVKAIEECVAAIMRAHRERAAAHRRLPLDQQCSAGRSDHRTTDPMVTSAAPNDERETAEGYCAKRADETHCVHWWDDDGPCCACGDDSHDDPVPAVLSPDPKVTDGIGRADRDRVQAEMTGLIPAAGDECGHTEHGPGPYDGRWSGSRALPGGGFVIEPCPATDDRSGQ